MKTAKKGSCDIGVLFAPGRLNDLSLNQYVFEQFKEKKIAWSYCHPLNNFVSIKLGLLHLVQIQKCKNIFILGSQCNLALDSFIKNNRAIIGKQKFYKVYAETHAQDSEICETLDFRESSLAETTGKILNDILKKKLDKEPSVVFLGGANVPVIRDFDSGLRSGLDERIRYQSFALGSNYSKFDDPMSGYWYTKYLLKTYNPTWY